MAWAWYAFCSVINGLETIKLFHRMQHPSIAATYSLRCALHYNSTEVRSVVMSAIYGLLTSSAARQHEKVLKEGLKPPKHNKFTSADAFRLATLGGAECLNMSHLIGSIEVGKKADIVIFDATSAN